MYDGVDDPEEYTTNEVLERAYAFGVASVCGDPDEAAYERLKRNSPDAYDETIIELAHDEGRANALELEAETDDPEAVWERLVESEFEWAGSAVESPGGPPEAIQAPEDGPSEGPPERLGLPSFLRRD